MKFIYCAECGKAQPAGKHCLWCGSTAEGSRVQEPVIRKNAADTFAAAERAVASGDFKRAQEQTASLARLLPDTATAYWLRTLAVNQCRDAAELIASGISKEIDPDFAMALQTASDIELAAYRQIMATVSEIRDALCKAIREYEIQYLRQKNIRGLASDYAQRTDACRAKLEERYAALEAAERAILELESEGTVLLHDTVQAQRTSESEILALSKELADVRGIEPEMSASLKQRISTAMQRSEFAATQFREMQEKHPWKEKETRLRQQLEKAAADCQRAEAELTSLNREIQNTTAELIAKEDDLHAAATAAMEYNFAFGIQFIGEERAVAVLRQAGLKNPVLPKNITKGR